jgi:hypothetical protein
MKQFCSYRFGFVKGAVSQSYVLPRRYQVVSSTFLILSRSRWGEQSCTVLPL